MSSPILNALGTIKLPANENLDRHEASLGIEVCPAMRSIQELDQIDSWNGGVFVMLAHLNGILSELGDEETIGEIEYEDIMSMDATLSDPRAVKRMRLSLPHLSDPEVKESLDAFRTGALCALATVYEKIKERTEPAPLSMVDEMDEEPEETFTPPRESVAIPTPSTKPENSSRTPRGDISAVLTKLVESGINLNNIVCIPRQDEKGRVRLALRVTFPSPVEFRIIAHINALLRDRKGTDISLKIINEGSRVSVGFECEI